MGGSLLGERKTRVSTPHVNAHQFQSQHTKSHLQSTGEYLSQAVARTCAYDNVNLVVSQKTRLCKFSTLVARDLSYSDFTRRESEELHG